MKIRLAILEKDQGYLKRIVNAFNVKYADKFEIYSFTDPAIAMSTLESTRIDVLVASDAFDINVSNVPRRCGFAYFVDSANVDMVNEQRAICKFQKADLIYKQILSIYSENASRVSGLGFDDNSCKLVAFSSPCGGVGTSSVAAACALRCAAMGKKTIYLNLEKYGSSDTFFSGEGQFDMSDIIFSLKSKKNNLALKLESCVKQDSRGVYFYSQSKIALDMLELGKEEMTELLSELKKTGSYDYIIVDIDFSLDENYLNVYRMMNFLVLVCDGSDIANRKLRRAYSAIAALDQGRDASLLSRLALIYNKFSNKTSKMIEKIEINNIGGVVRYEHASTKQVITQLSNMAIFDKIL